MAGSGVFAEIKDGDGVFRYYSDGEWKASASGKSVPIINPTTRSTHFHVQGTASELQRFFCRFSLKHQLLTSSAGLNFFGWFPDSNSLYTRGGEQDHRISKACAEVMGQDSTVEES